MARVNVGVNPLYLADQHLIAESVEITMITGNLKLNECKIKSRIPEQFSLGKGHMNFFKDKLLYLEKRLFEVNNEMSRRGFNNSTYIDLDLYPDFLINDWSPTLKDSTIVRSRIIERLQFPRKKQDPFKYWRYEKKLINYSLDKFCDNIMLSNLFHV